MEDIKLNDSVLAHLAKLLQLSIMTGTDIIDHMRQIRLTVEDGEAYLTERYEAQSEANIQRMLTEIENITNATLAE
jgi:hypothetical protein